MKKTVIAILIVMSMMLISGCGCEHEWKEADCITPATCSKCGKTEGEALGHEWEEADCEKPETCSRCQATQGEPTGHEFTINHTEKDFINTENVEMEICTACGTVVNETRTKMNRLHDGKQFTFTMSEYAARLDKLLSSVDMGAVFQTALDVNGYSVFAIIDNYENVIGYIECHDKNAKPLNDVDKASVVITQFFFFSEDKEALATAVAGVVALDPTLTWDSAAELLDDAFNKTVSKNGVYYYVAENDSGFTVIASLIA